MQHPECVSKSKDLFHTKHRGFTCQKQLMTNLVTDSEKALKGTQVEKAHTTNWD